MFWKCGTFRISRKSWLNVSLLLVVNLTLYRQITVFPCCNVFIKHFFRIFYRFWSEWFRCFRSCKILSSALHVWCSKVSTTLYCNTRELTHLIHTWINILVIWLKIPCVIPQLWSETKAVQLWPETKGVIMCYYCGNVLVSSVLINLTSKRSYIYIL